MPDFLRLPPAPSLPPVWRRELPPADGLDGLLFFCTRAPPSSSSSSSSSSWRLFGGGASSSSFSSTMACARGLVVIFRRRVREGQRPRRPRPRAFPLPLRSILRRNIVRLCRSSPPYALIVSWREPLRGATARRSAGLAYTRRTTLFPVRVVERVARGTSECLQRAPRAWGCRVREALHTGALAGANADQLRGDGARRRRRQQRGSAPERLRRLARVACLARKQARRPNPHRPEPGNKRAPIQPRQRPTRRPRVLPRRDLGT